MTADDFAFSRDSELWLVNRYANGLLFGPAAVLLQVAHPRVAQGVADHSDFREDALGRLRRTLSTVNQIAFGTKEAAEKMRARLRVVHGGVNGAISEGMAEPKNYSAFEPDLLMWVLATLIDASIKGYEFVWEPLSEERRENFYRDFRRFGTYFGLGEEVGPQGYIEVEKYYAEMLSGGVLGGHPLCAEVAAAVAKSGGGCSHFPTGPRRRHGQVAPPWVASPRSSAWSPWGRRGGPQTPPGPRRP